MSISPKRVAVQVAVRSLQLEGDNQSELEASYTTGYTDLDGKQVPASGLVDAVIAVEAEIAELIANDRNHPYRAALYGRSSDLASEDLIPSVSNGNIEFIGMFSGVNDATDHLPVTEGAIQEIWRYLRRGASRYTTDIRKYKMFNGRIYHTRTNVYLEGCVFSRTAALARFSSSDLSPLPISVESLWVARTLQFLAQEGWFIPEASFYGGFVDTCINRLKMRETTLPSLPSNQSSANAAAD